MIMKLSDFQTEAAEKYADHLRRYEVQRAKKSKSGMILWLKRALYWAMDHKQDFHVRQLMQQAEQMP